METDNADNIESCCFNLSAVIAVRNELAETCLASHSKRNIDSATNHYEKAWSLADSVLIESSLFVASEKSAFYRRCGEGLMNCLRELAPPNWLGQSMDILKRMIEKSSHEDINPSNVLYTVGCLMGCAWHRNSHA